MSPEQLRILVAEDEAPLRNLVCLSLEAAGYAAVPAVDGEEALGAFMAQPVDMAILDVMMPKMDGFAVCQEIRKRSDVPIIMLTALSGTEDLVRGFELGADDYIAKPFSFKEVQARVQAILRRAQWAEEKHRATIISIGRVTINNEVHQVTVDGQPLHLTPIEFQLLFTLMASAGRPLSKVDLFRQVWGYDFLGGTNLVEVTVRRLREKVEADPSCPELILTVRGVGYKFRAADRRVAEDAP